MELNMSKCRSIRVLSKPAVNVMRGLKIPTPYCPLAGFAVPRTSAESICPRLPSRDEIDTYGSALQGEPRLSTAPDVLETAIMGV